MRTALLVAAVALSAALIAAVACAIASINHAVELQIDAQMGTAEVRIRPPGSGQTIDASVLELARGWDGVDTASPRRRVSASIGFTAPVLAEQDGAFVHTDKMLGAGAILNASTHDRLSALDLIAGRLPQSDNEIVIDALLAERLSAKFALAGRSSPGYQLGGGDTAFLGFERPDVPDRLTDAAEADAINNAVGVRPGDTVQFVRLLRRSVDLTVVAVAKPPPLGGRPQAYALPGVLGLVGENPDKLTEIEIDLAEGVDAERFVEANRPNLPPDLMLTTTERVTTAVRGNLAANQMGFILASMLAFLTSAFIIMTGLTTGLAQQQRSLAILRCIGATRWQLAQAQLFTGTTLGVLGALVGVPMGMALAWTLVTVYADRVPGGLIVPQGSLTITIVGALLAGLIGSAWPAFRAARLSPLQGLSLRARPAAMRGIVIVSLVALALIGLMLALFLIPRDEQVVFWLYATAGLPALFVGYFLLGVPVVAVLSWLASPALTKLLRLPPGLLAGVIRATPYRHGFTAGAMMAGLALMVALWINGGAFMTDWLGRISFPDAFVSGLSLTPQAQKTIDELPFVESTCAITLQPVETGAFGIEAFDMYKSMFVAFEPAPFFDTVSLEFIQGDQETALRRLEAGGAVLVAREFNVAKGLGVGDSITLRGPAGSEHSFEIVGVVTSPGLELVSQFFNIGEDFIDQAMHAVFGSRDDLRERFGSEAIQLIQIDLTDDADDRAAVTDIRKALFGAGIMDAGSGRRIKDQIMTLVRSGLVVFSSVAIGAMLIACVGVANLVAAGIEARRYEFGVLRAVGGGRSLLVRLIAAEALLVALAACLVGTAFGLVGAWAGRVLDAIIIGIDIPFIMPWKAVAAGWAFVILLTLAAAVPALMRLNRRTVRDLLTSQGQ